MSYRVFYTSEPTHSMVDHVFMVLSMEVPPCLHSVLAQPLVVLGGLAHPAPLNWRRVLGKEAEFWSIQPYSKSILHLNAHFRLQEKYFDKVLKFSAGIRQNRQTSANTSICLLRGFSLRQHETTNPQSRSRLMMGQLCSCWSLTSRFWSPKEGCCVVCCVRWLLF